MPTSEGEQTWPRIARNDWGIVACPPLRDWTPTLRVSVVIPAYDCQDTLDLTLAALSVQTYPEQLLEVVVVDDGSAPALRLPEARPANCRLIRAAEGGWGRAYACDVGAMASRGEVIQWLDADLLVFPEHIEAQARWHHVLPDAVVIGYKRFVDVGGGLVSREQVLTHAREGRMAALFDEQAAAPHWIEKVIDQTDGLRREDFEAFRVHTGATASLRRALYFEAGRMNTTLRLGEDTELGYRLAQAGAVFIPEPESRSWHLGASSMMQAGDALRRFNHAFLADLMPVPRYLRRRVTGRIWSVPLVTAVLEVDGHPLELVRDCVDRVLSSDEEDLRVVLVGSWDRLQDRRRGLLDDTDLDLRLVHATYAGDPRVSYRTAAPETVFPSTFLLRLPVAAGVGHQTVRLLLRQMEERRAGVLTAGVVGGRLEMWRTSARSRASRVRKPGEDLADVVTEVCGAAEVDGARFGLVDLRQAGGTPPRWLRHPRSLELDTTLEGYRRRIAQLEQTPSTPPRRLFRGLVRGLVRYARRARRRSRRLTPRA